MAPLTNASVIDAATAPWRVYEFEFERSFVWADGTGPWMRDTVPVAVAIALTYVFLVFAGQRFMRDRPAFDLRGPLIAWNGLLTVLSWIMALRLVPALVMRMAMYPLTDTFCDMTFRDGTTGFWIFIFAASKTPELLDTAFLVLRKKEVILLHWYHHFTVLLYCWYSFAAVAPACLWFTSMNSFVHAFMYLYYFQTARGKTPKWNKVITIIQILQMLIGSSITVYDMVRETPCTDKIPLYTGAVMYLSYFCLFVHLFYDMYCGAGAKKRAAKRAAAKAKAPAAVTATTVQANGTSVHADSAKDTQPAKVLDGSKSDDKSPAEIKAIAKKDQ